VFIHDLIFINKLSYVGIVRGEKCIMMFPSPHSLTAEVTLVSAVDATDASS